VGESHPLKVAFGNVGLEDITASRFNSKR